MRLAGMIGFNPMFSRRNVPAQLRVGLIFVLSILLAPNVSTGSFVIVGTLDVIVMMLKELFVGLVCGFVFQIFYYLLFFAGDLMDIQFGLSMAKVFDPGSGIQMSVSGNFLSLLFMLYIFATDSHLLLIRIFATSFDIIAVGAVSISPDVATFIIELFMVAFSLVMRLAMPFVAAEFVLEMSMGVLMKLIPQIHVFVINIQFKILLGITLLMMFAGPIGSFTDNFMRLMFQNIQDVLYILA